MLGLHGAKWQELWCLVDRYKGWPGVFTGGTRFDVTRLLARLCEDYGVPVSCASDGGPNLTAKAVGGHDDYIWHVKRVIC